MSTEPVAHEEMEAAVRLLRDVVVLRTAPELPESLARIDDLRLLYDTLIELRRFLFAASSGDLSQEIPFRGYLWGTLKALQANLRHLTWQTKMVAEGDFSQRVQFMGEFAQSFNTMVEQLDNTLKALVAKETELEQANGELLKEIAIRKHTEAALLEREETLRRLATTDSLTGLYNRRHFSQLAENEIQRLVRYGRPLAAIMFDIDHFKHVNDTYGHINGDKVIKMIADTTLSLVRTTDIAARYGGEEFILLLPETRAAEAAEVAERLRARVEATPVDTGGEVIAVTASFGVSDRLDASATLSSDALLAAFISHADEALYRSKNNGRNRVTIHGQ